MDAKSRFKEGWIILLRPFDFAELSKPLQKMTILYAYSEKPIINMILTEKGKELLNEWCEYSDKEGKSSVTNMHPFYSRMFRETDKEYKERMDKHYDDIYRLHATQEEYKGELVQCYVEKTLCKFFPEEYNVISRETFEHILTCDEQEYKIEIEDPKFFDTKNIKDKLFYIQSRGINSSMSMKMNAKEAKDAVIFRPQPAILEMFCKEHEIY